MYSFSDQWTSMLFPLFILMNNVTMNILINVSWYTYAKIPANFIPRSKAACSILLDNAKIFSKVMAPLIHPWAVHKVPYL